MSDTGETANASPATLDAHLDSAESKKTSFTNEHEEIQTPNTDIEIKKEFIANQTNGMATEPLAMDNDHGNAADRSDVIEPKADSNLHQHSEKELESTVLAASSEKEDIECARTTGDVHSDNITENQQDEIVDELMTWDKEDDIPVINDDNAVKEKNNVDNELVQDKEEGSVDDEPVQEMEEDNNDDEPMQEKEEDNVDDAPVQEKEEDNVDEPVQEKEEDNVDDAPVQEKEEDNVDDEPLQEKEEDNVDDEPLQEKEEDNVDDEPLQEKEEDNVDDEPLQENDANVSDVGELKREDVGVSENEDLNGDIESGPAEEKGNFEANLKKPTEEIEGIDADTGEGLDKMEETDAQEEMEVADTGDSQAVSQVEGKQTEPEDDADGQVIQDVQPVEKKEDDNEEMLAVPEAAVADTLSYEDQTDKQTQNDKEQVEGMLDKETLKSDEVCKSPSEAILEDKDGEEEKTEDLDEKEENKLLEDESCAEEKVESNTPDTGSDILKQTDDKYDIVENTADSSKESKNDKSDTQKNLEETRDENAGKDQQELMIQDVRELNEEKMEEENNETAVIKEKIDQDVEMEDMSEEKKDAAEDEKTVEDVEMTDVAEDKTKDEKKEESDDSAKKTKEETAEGKNDLEDKVTNENDLKIIDIRSDDEEGEKKSLINTSDIKEENKDEDGGMCLQIASVSGGTDIDLFKDDEIKQEDEKKVTVKQEESKISVKTEQKNEEKVSSVLKKEIKQEAKAPAASKPSSKAQSCIVCFKVGKCKYNIVRNGDIKHLCDDVCFKRFRSNPTMFLRATTESQQKKPDTPPTTTPAASTPSQPTVPPPQEHYKTCSICQLMNLKTSKPFLNWQGMDFCGEDCLGKFQGGLNASCSFCGKSVTQAAKGKFCSRVGNEVKQFCSGPCFTEFKKRQKLCECCQKDLSKNADAFVAPVGKDAVFKDFCSQGCHLKYEERISADSDSAAGNQVQKSQHPPKGNFTCAVCSKTGPVKHEIRLDEKMNRLCSDPCFSAFQYANKLFMNTCDNCGIYCYKDGSTPQFIQFEGQQKRFCSFMCVNSFKTLNKKIVSCAWCNCKKNNFDMIERVDANNKYQLFCSLNCLSLYRVNLQATSNQAVVCDQCRKCVPAQYHLTMSDASVRNFCSYQCVMAFQSQFSSGTKSQQFVNNHNNTSPAAQTNQPRVSTRASARSTAGKNSQANVPIISNVVSLAQEKPAPKKESPAILRGPPQQQTNRGNSGTGAVLNHLGNNRPVTVNQQTQVQQQIIIQPPPPKAVKNKCLLCKPFVQTKATSCRPHTQTKETQTEEDFEPKKYVFPVPIPYYVPMPMQMWSQPTPVPIPIPVPIPVPVFIPTTKKSANGIMKQIKEIQERIPSDPLEAELLMMAEAVAGGEPESDSDSDKSDMEQEAPASKIPRTSPTPPPTSADKEAVAPAEASEFGEDMLQMALRMATEMTSEPVMDLETSIDPVPVSTEPPPPPPRALPEEEDDADYTPVRETRSRGRGQKRSSSRGGRRSKRQKVVHNLEPDRSTEEQPLAEPEPQEPPADANFYLKYTYGVNAWKHWVVLKNAQLEKVSKTGSGKLKLFKTDMMGCTADELNYSLCLFVKEVRKPNGEEYAPDSIHYLCLGIQQYLFENGRIDNIFTDMYYEKFTECLNEVLSRYEPRVNTAGQLVCRIEEEHLWECKQLGAHSPHVLLNTLVYFNTKYFMLKESDDHLRLSFTHIMKHWKKCPIGRGNTTGRSVYLRYYCPTPTKSTNDMNQKKKQKEELPVYEQAENTDNPLRCPVKLYEFYLSKCPESIKNRNDAFYLTPERSCVPDSPVWYSTQNLSAEAMNKMLNRVRLVREIQEAMLHTQPITNCMT